MSPQTFIFIGRSGCGKGTQSALLQTYLKEKDPTREIFYMETGQNFRDFIQSPGYSQTLAKQIQDNGGLQPAFLAVWMWSNVLIEKLTPDMHLFVDGTPRKLGEAIIFNEAMKFYSRRPYIIHIDVSREWSENRLRERHRVDDLPDAVGRRLDWFDAEVKPAIDYFRTSPDVDFLEITGERSIEAIQEDIKKALNL